MRLNVIIWKSLTKGILESKHYAPREEVVKWLVDMIKRESRKIGLKEKTEEQLRVT